MFAFLLLAVLYAHEETSYPRRKRMEYTVENDSILLKGLKWIKDMNSAKLGVMSARVNSSSPVDSRTQFDCILICAGIALGSLGLELLFTYWFEFADCVSFSWAADSGTWIVGLVLLSVGVCMELIRWNCHTQHDYFKDHKEGIIVTAFCISWFGVQALGISSIAHITSPESNEHWNDFLSSFGFVVPLAGFLAFLTGCLISSVGYAKSTDWGRGIVENFVRAEEDRKDLTAGFAAENYTDRYTRRYRELQCTPIQDFHISKFEEWKSAAGVGFGPEQAPFYEFFQPLLKLNPAPKGDNSGVDPDPTKEPVIKHIEQLYTSNLSNLVHEAAEDPSEKMFYAGSVADMIVVLSKARQRKMWHLWRPLLWFVSLAHASIPVVYTFVATMPWVAASVGLLLFVSALLASLKTFDQKKIRTLKKQLQQNQLHVSGMKLNRIKMQKKVQARAAAKERGSISNEALIGERNTQQLTSEIDEVDEAIKNAAESVKCTDTLKLNARSYLMRGCYLGAAILVIGGCFEGSNVNHSGQCKQILDTQGECCCDITAQSVVVLRAAVERGQQCCPSDFSEDDRVPQPKGGSRLYSDARCTDKTTERDRNCDVGWPNGTPNGTSIPSEQPGGRLCFDQQWLEDKANEKWFAMQSSDKPEDLLKTVQSPVIGSWCAGVNQALNSLACNSERQDENKVCQDLVTQVNFSYVVAKQGESACMLPYKAWPDLTSNWLFKAVFVNDAHSSGCLACGGNLFGHLCNFWATAQLTFAIVSRLYRCYEDYFVQYHRMLYLLQLTPWSSMAHLVKEESGTDVHIFHKHESWGLLPTFDMDKVANIVAWNKLRLYLQTYENRSSERLQVSVVYLLLAWVGLCIYQAVKLWYRGNLFDVESMFMLSTTVILAGGLSSILITGKWINDVTQRGFPHVLRVKQSEVLDKSTHFLVEHDLFNGRSLHSKRLAQERQCHHHKGIGANGIDHDRKQYGAADLELFNIIDAISKTKKDRERGASAIYNGARPSLLDKGAFENASPRDRGPDGREGFLKKKAQQWMGSRTLGKAWIESQIEEHVQELTSEDKKNPDAQLCTIKQLEQKLAQATRERDSYETHRENVAKCHKMLDNLITTCLDEYSGDGARSHWGAQDRRAKLGFIVMSEGTVKFFATTLLTGLLPAIIHTFDTVLSTD